MPSFVIHVLTPSASCYALSHLRNHYNTYFDCNKQKTVVSEKIIFIHTKLTSFREADILINFNILYLAKIQHSVNSSIPKKAKQFAPLIYNTTTSRSKSEQNNKPWRNQNHRRKQEKRMETPCFKSVNAMVSHVYLSPYYCLKKLKLNLFL